MTSGECMGVIVLAAALFQGNALCTLLLQGCLWTHYLHELGEPRFRTDMQVGERPQRAGRDFRPAERLYLS